MNDTLITENRFVNVCQLANLPACLLAKIRDSMIVWWIQCCCYYTIYYGCGCRCRRCCCYCCLLNLLTLTAICIHFLFYFLQNFMLICFRIWLCVLPRIFIFDSPIKKLFSLSFYSCMCVCVSNSMHHS